jgi:hypothetical protein
MGSDRAAMAVVKMALQLGFLEDAQNNQSELALSQQDQLILNELVNRNRKS